MNMSKCRPCSKGVGRGGKRNAWSPVNETFGESMQSCVLACQMSFVSQSHAYRLCRWRCARLHMRWPGGTLDAGGGTLVGRWCLARQSTNGQSIGGARRGRSHALAIYLPSHIFFRLGGRGAASLIYATFSFGAARTARDTTRTASPSRFVRVGSGRCRCRCCGCLFRGGDVCKYAEHTSNERCGSA